MGRRRKWKTRKRATPQEKHHKIIGPYTHSQNLDTGNGHKFAHVRHQANMIPMNTRKRPKNTMQEKQRIKKAKTPAQTCLEIQTEQLTTWISPEGKTARQIDYRAINQRYRNTVRKAQTIQGWQENMAQQKQHKVIQMDICLKLLKHYDNLS